jgi:hypothetical protein
MHPKIMDVRNQYVRDNECKHQVLIRVGLSPKFSGAKTRPCGENVLIGVRGDHFFFFGLVVVCSLEGLCVGINRKFPTLKLIVVIEEWLALLISYRVDFILSFKAPNVTIDRGWSLFVFKRGVINSLFSVGYH